MAQFPRTRRQTRAALLGHLLTAGDCFRGELVERLDLTEASISRIVAELKSEGLVSEYARRPAPYPGGPTNVVAINRSIRVAAVELSNGRVSAGIGNLAGAIERAERIELSASAQADEVTQAVVDVTARLAAWAGQQGIAVQQVGLSLPGYGALGDINAIVPAGAQRLVELIGEPFAGVPISVTNSVQAQAAMHGFGIHAKALDQEHLFVFIGHGIGAARVGHMAWGASQRPVEIGHMVMDPAGPLCRCGHRGCVEAFAALPALAATLGVPEEQLLAAGDQGFQSLRPSVETQDRIEAMLRRIGLAVGNALNIDPVESVVIAGWPSLMTPELRNVLLQALDASVLGGLAHRRIQVAFIPPSIGNDPLPTLCYAAYSFVQRGAMEPGQPTEAEPQRARRGAAA